MLRAHAVGIALAMIISGLFVPFLSDSNSGMVEASEVEQETRANETYLRVALQDDPYSLNVYSAHTIWDWAVLGWILDQPIEIDEQTGEALPYLAESWDIKDSRNATLTFRKGIFW